MAHVTQQSRSEGFFRLPGVDAQILEVQNHMLDQLERNRVVEIPEANIHDVANAFKRFAQIYLEDQMKEGAFSKAVLASSSTKEAARQLLEEGFRTAESKQQFLGILIFLNYIAQDQELEKEMKAGEGESAHIDKAALFGLFAGPLIANMPLAETSDIKELMRLENSRIERARDILLAL